jgi:S1-C subfamily serine protease
VNSYDTKPRDSFAPQKPQQTPWLAICLLVATTFFVVGDIASHLIGAQAPATQTIGAPPGQSVIVKHGSKNPIADIAAAVEPGVVSIDTTIAEDNSGSISLPDLLDPNSHGTAKQPSHMEARGTGSGIVIRSDGYIMTNNHVVKDARNIKVTLNDKRVYTGHVVGTDDYSDIAVIKIDAGGLTPLRLGESKTVRPGDWAIAVGTPLGLTQTVTMGIVSAVGRSLSDLNNNVDLIQTSAPINPGNSGGPLINIDGDVIGINMAIRTDAQNIGFSIPVDVAKQAAQGIMDHKPLSHPYLGISMLDYDPDAAAAAGLSERIQGVIVAKIENGSPASHSGIAVGDLIERVNNIPVKTGSDVQKIVRAHKVGNRMDLTILHKGKRQDVELTLTPYPAS